MQVMNEKDYKLFERLVSLNQKELKNSMEQYIRSKYGKNTIITKDYIVGIGEIPIALVAHMDTVFKVPATELYYDRRKDVMWSPQGLGGDDRAGVFAIIKILQSGLRPSVILTTDEEQGGLGAAALALTDCPIPGLKYMIELDRRGSNDCVFYDCYCPEFIEYVESFGFCEKWGSFSDISFLMPEWDICGVNLSVGYDNEHSYIETLNTKPLYDTIRKVKKMLTVEEIPTFKYAELPMTNYMGSWYGSGYSLSNGKICKKCKKSFSEYEMFPAIAANGKTEYYCPDCAVDSIDWCEYCSEPFVKTRPNQKICHFCMEGGLCTTTSNSNSEK